MTTQLLFLTIFVNLGGILFFIVWRRNRAIHEFSRGSGDLDEVMVQLTRLVQRYRGKLPEWEALRAKVPLDPGAALQFYDRAKNDLDFLLKEVPVLLAARRRALGSAAPRIEKQFRHLESDLQSALDWASRFLPP